MAVIVFSIASVVLVLMRVRGSVGMRVLVGVRYVLVSVLAIGVIVRMRVLRAVGVRVLVGVLLVLHAFEICAAALKFMLRNA
jgi:hypothetical protein